MIKNTLLQILKCYATIFVIFFVWVIIMSGYFVIVDFTVLVAQIDDVLSGDFLTGYPNRPYNVKLRKAYVQ